MREDGLFSIRSGLVVSLIAASAGLVTEASAQDTDDRYELRIEGGSLLPVARSMRKQTGAEIVYSFELADENGINPVRGQYTLEQALAIMFEGTDLTGSLTESGVIVITREIGVQAPSREESDVNRKTIRKSLLASVSAAIFGAGGAAAQTEAVSNDSNLERQLDTITVTASKRATDLQDTPISITVLGSEEIESRALMGMEDYLRSIPSASFIDRGPGFHELVLRGLSTSAQGSGDSNGPLVGVYFGETPISGLGVSGGTADIKLIDMERVEVLKGPQGTLYGASAMGGVVRNIPAAPLLDEFSASIKTEYSQTSRLGSGNANVQAMVNLPIVEDKFALRAVGYHFDNSGHYRNISANDPAAIAVAESVGGNTTIQDDIGATTYTGGRINALWTPTESLSVSLGYLHQEVETFGWGQAQDGIGGTYDQSRLLIRRGIDGALPTNESATAPINNESFDDTIKIANATIDYDLGWGTITSATSLVQEDVLWPRDLTSIFIGAQEQQYDSESLTQEIRLATDLDGPFQFVVGYFFEDRENSFANNIVWNGDLALIPMGALEFFQFRSSEKLEQNAVFGEASFDLTEQLTITGGARWFDQERTADNQRAFNGDPLVSNPLSIGVSDISFKAGIDYRATDDALFYASWTEGFRLGNAEAAIPFSECDVDMDGFYDQQPNIPTGDRAIDSDDINTFELGSKAELFDGRLRVSAAAYQTNWNNIPVSVPVCADIAATTVNGGQARVRGIEIETAYEFGNGFALDLSGSWTEGELTNTNSLGADGDRLPSTPDFNVNAGLSYEFDLGENPAFVRGSYSYNGTFFGEIGSAGPRFGDYGRVDASAGVQIGDFDLMVFGRNLTNTEAITAIVFSFDNRRSYLRPRTVGIQLGYNF